MWLMCSKYIKQSTVSFFDYQMNTTKDIKELTIQKKYSISRDSVTTSFSIPTYFDNIFVTDCTMV